MKDRFKFRVWDRGKTQYSICNYVIDDEGLLWQVESAYRDELWKSECKDYIIELCVGLKDIKGKPIYDGDIVEYEDVYYTVEWHHRGGYNGYEATNKYHGSVLWTEMLSSTMIIGNIHENPELLK